MNANEVYEHLCLGGMAHNIDHYWQQWLKEDPEILSLDFFPSREKKVFEVGSGNGATVRILYKDYRCLTIASEVSKERIKDLKNGDVSNLVLFYDANKDNIPLLSKSIDYVMAFEVMEHLSNPYYAISEMKRICKEEKGYIHLSIPDYEQQQGYGDHQHAFVYPGLFKPEYFEIFLLQFGLKIAYHKLYYLLGTFNNVKNKIGSQTRNEKPLHHYYILSINKYYNLDPLALPASNINMEEYIR